MRRFLSISVRFGIGATIRIGLEIQCLPYAGFFLEYTKHLLLLINVPPPFNSYGLLAGVYKSHYLSVCLYICMFAPPPPQKKKAAILKQCSVIE